MIGPGDLVQCVSAVAATPGVQIARPEPGSIYTIRGVYDGFYQNDPTVVPSAFLEEIVNPIVAWNGSQCELGFPLFHFKPIRKPDIKSLEVYLKQDHKVPEHVNS
jgi:hypothetical protein